MIEIWLQNFRSIRKRPCSGTLDIFLQIKLKAHRQRSLVYGKATSNSRKISGCTDYFLVASLCAETMSKYTRRLIRYLATGPAITPHTHKRTSNKSISRAWLRLHHVCTRAAQSVYAYQLGKIAEALCDKWLLVNDISYILKYHIKFCCFDLATICTMHASGPNQMRIKFSFDLDLWYMFAK